MNWPRPKQLLVKCGHQWPMLWKYVDLARAERGQKLPRWPDWCYLSTAAGPFLIETRLPVWERRSKVSVLRLRRVF